MLTTNARNVTLAMRNDMTTMQEIVSIASTPTQPNERSLTMSNYINVRPIEAVLADVRQEMWRSLDATRKRYAERIKNIEEHRRLLPMLDAEGLPINVYDWEDLASIRIDLGVRPETKRGRAEFARKLQAIRRVLECPLKFESKSLADARKKLVRMYLKAEQYPNVTVVYSTKLPKGAKCRVVRKKVRFTEHQLLCEV